jgi:hypothetical protein
LERRRELDVREITLRLRRHRQTESQAHRKLRPLQTQTPAHQYHSRTIVTPSQTYLESGPFSLFDLLSPTASFTQSSRPTLFSSICLRTSIEQYLQVGITNDLITRLGDVDLLALQIEQSFRHASHGFGSLLASPENDFTVLVDDSAEFALADDEGFELSLVACLLEDFGLDRMSRDESEDEDRSGLTDSMGSVLGL